MGQNIMSCLGVLIWHPFGVGKGVLFRELFSFQRSGIEGFHCISTRCVHVSV